MILKQYFTDGLVQIAIILSLLRTDLNNYINSNFVNYPEVQEIILGQTAAVTRTNFHNYNNYVNNLHGHGHPKAIDNDISFILQDLRSLNRLSSWHTNINRRNRIPAFLVSLSNSQPGSAIVTSDASIADTTNNNVQEDVTSPNTQTQSQEEESETRGTEEVVLGADCTQCVGLPNGDLTSEDLDLIDVLWRQDIDLGVGKEVFDINLRRELERERELELQKDRQQQKEKELVQLKLEEQRRRQEQQWLMENYMRDGETGEWVPLNGRARNQPPQTITSPQNISVVPNVNIPPVQNVSLSPVQGVGMPQMQNISNMQNGTNHNLNQTNQFQNYLSYDTGMPLMNNNNLSQHHITDSSLRRELENDYHMTSSELSGSYHHQSSSVQQLPQEQNHLQPYNYTQQSVQQNSPPYQRQESLEQTWQDLVNLLELPSNESSLTTLSNMTNNNNISGGRMMPPMPNSMMSPTQNHSNVLLHNATMPSAISNATQNTSFEQAVPMTSTNLTSTTPSEGCTSPLEWNPTSMLFPNSSSPLEQNRNLEEVDDILTDIIDEGLEDLNITEMALNDGLRSMQMLDDASSESGVSMGSSGSPSQNDQFSDSAMSPFDGLEGATGGKDYGDSPNYNKGSDSYNFSNGGYGFNSDNGGEHSQSNYSTSSNDTDFKYRPASTNHIRHNHSYPLQPGQEPREYKKYPSIDKPKQKGPHCRDKKKIQEMKVPLTMDQIVESPVEEFNELLTRHKLSEPQLQLIRDIRRRGKNKVAAQNCRKRKMDVILTLEDDMSSLKDKRDKLLAERQMIDRQTKDMKEKFSSLYREIFQSLRDEHGRPYDPHHFSLQQSSDGNVFLVPRNVTADEQQAKASSKKRKNENGKKDL